MSTARPTGIVRRLWKETPHLTGVVLEVSPELAAQYTRPGQVVVLRPNDHDQIYLAIASAPGEVQALELLIGEAGMAKAKLEQGARVQLDPPSGPGFKLEMAEGRDVLLFAVGSGLAPVRPLIQHFRKNRSDYGQIILYVGAHTEADFPYQAEFQGWKRDRIDVVRSVSKPWVQDRFREEAPDVRNAVAFVVGMKAMIEGVTAALTEAGLDKERIGEKLVNDAARAFREGAAVLPRPELRTLRLVGPDRERYLNGQISSDLSLLRPGQGQRAVKPSPKGRVEGLLRVRGYADRYELDLDQAVLERVATNLERFIIMDDCQVQEVSGDRAVLGVYGPNAAEVLAAVGWGAAEGLENLAFLEKGAWTVIRDGLYGVDGFELYGPKEELEGRLGRLVEAGARRVTPEDFEIFRVEAGVPKDGVDVDDEIIPLEAGLEGWLSLEKGCYVGQEVIARATNFGGVKHRLVHLWIEGEEVPSPRSPLFVPGADKATGEVRSAVRSAVRGRILALGYVRIVHEAPGTVLEVRDGSGARAREVKVAARGRVG